MKVSFPSLYSIYIFVAQEAEAFSRVVDNLWEVLSPHTLIRLYSGMHSFKSSLIFTEMHYFVNRQGLKVHKPT